MSRKRNQSFPSELESKARVQISKKINSGIELISRQRYSLQISSSRSRSSRSEKGIKEFFCDPRLLNRSNGFHSLLKVFFRSNKQQQRQQQHHHQQQNNNNSIQAEVEMQTMPYRLPRFIGSRVHKKLGLYEFLYFHSYFIIAFFAEHQEVTLAPFYSF